MVHGGSPVQDRAALRERWHAQGWFGEADLAAAFCDEGAAEGTVVFAAADSRVPLTRSRIVDDARRIARGLIDLGIGPGDVVAVQSPTSRRSLTAMVGIWLCGGVVLPVVTTLGPRDLEFILRQSRARALCVPHRWRTTDFAAQARRLADHLPELSTIIALDDQPPAGAVGWADLISSAPLATLPNADPDEICLLIYTSGTTSEPKGVQHTHNSVLAATRRRSLGAGRVLAAFPSGHIAGLLGSVSPLLQGGITVIMDRWSAAEAAKLIEEYRLEASSGTPFFLTTLLDEARSAGRDISSLTRFLTGAASVPPSLMNRAQGLGIVSWRTYGSTEHPVLSSGTPDDPEEKRHGTDGRVTDGNEVRLVDDEGADVPPGAEGEIVARGPRQFAGYRDAALDAEAFLPGGWFRTGDIGRFDADGYLIITDRKKDIIIRGGENIASREVEDLLVLHPGIAEAAVCAAPDPLLGEQVCAFVVPRPGAHIDLDVVRAHFAGLGVARHKAPERVETVTDLPRTPTGKVKKTELRTLLRTDAEPRVRSENLKSLSRTDPGSAPTATNFWRRCHPQRWRTLSAPRQPLKRSILRALSSTI
jgi:acyl-CoA synthetase (AMP-forming)/AMP-acid ligase II